MLTNSDDENAPGLVNRVNTTLVSPTISTVGYNALNFSYRTYYRRVSSDQAVVEVSTNGGASWIIVKDLTAGGTIGTLNGFVTQTIDLSSYINNASFQVRFRFTTNNQWWWAVDDINLTGTAVSANNYSWTAIPAATSGLSAAAGIPSPANANIVVTPTATGSKAYTVTLTNAFGCTSTKSTTVTVGSVPVVSITANYCFTPGKVRLAATSVPAATSYLWSTGATTSFIDVDVAGNFDVTVFAGGFCPGTSNIDIANELVVNGDFEAGNTGFTSPPLGANQYKYQADVAGTTELFPEGLYGIDTDPQKYHTNFWGSDHTTGLGNFMIVNGFPNGNPQPIVWQETVNVLPNTAYYFSAWAMSLNKRGPFANLQFNVNGAQVGTNALLGTGVEDISNSGWTRFYGTLTTGPATTTAIISITDLQTAAGGNDFGLDDISFSTLSTFINLESAPGTDGQTLCVNTPLTEIEYSIGNGNTGGPTVSGLPAGVTSVFAQARLDFDGTPTVPGNYTYSITTTGCSPFTVTGTISVQGQKITLSSGSASPNICVNTPMSDIVYTFSGTATGVTYAGLPAGVTGSSSGTISGTPTVPGTYNYIVATTGTCEPDTARGTITVQSQSITLNSGNDAQTVCINAAISNIQYTIGGTGNGASVSGLPPGVSGTYNSGLFIISGSPISAAGSPYTYTVTTSGASCAVASITGTITVTPAAVITLTSGAGTNPQTACKGIPVTDVTFAVNGATGAGVSGLPAGVNGLFNAGIFTISGIPTAGGIFNYTITTTGGCGSATATGTITVQEQTISLTSGAASPSLCANTVLSNIVYTLGGTAASATVSGLPTGVSGVLAGNLFTISGTPAGPAGPYPYTITTSGSCGPATANGTISVSPAPVGGNLTSILVCSASSGNITLSGQSGTIQRWEVSTNGGATWVPIANTTITQSYTNITQPAMYRVVVGSSGCNLVNSTVATVSIRNLWTGLNNTDWNTAGNWSGNVLPSISCPDVYIPGGTPNQPVLSGGLTGTINNLHISLGATLTVNGTGILQIAGTITSNGIFDVSNGTIELNGSSPQTIGAGIFMNNAIKDLVISNSTGAGVTLNGALDVYHSLTYGAAGTLFATNDFLTLKSNAAGTAWLGDMTGHTITGNVTVERYIPPRKAWRFLSVPTQTAQTIHQAWQENQPTGSTTPSGLGTQITSDRPTWAADDFDLFSPGGPSMKTYDPASDTYTGVATTNAAFVPALGGYMTFIRGDRTANSFASAATPTVLRTQGPLFTGTKPAIPVTVTITPYMNPYAAPLDKRLLSPSGNAFFYIWDPNRGGNYGLGAWQTFSLIGGNYVATPGGSPSYPGGIGNFIESGQAFLVSGTGSITINEASKGPGSGQMVFRPASAPQQQLRSNLLAVNADGSTFLADGVLNIFSDTYSNEVDGMDAKKLTNFGENLSTKKSGQLLVIERKHTITSQDTIFFNLSGVKVQQYQFEFIADKLDQPGLVAFLEDNYTHTKTPLNLNASTLVNFTVVNIPGSYARDRFRVVFAPSVVLPVTFTSVKAYRQDKNINVEWRVENEKNMKQYEVEKSVNGTQFSTLGIVPATANNGNPATYLSTDTKPLEGTNYYRVKSVDIDGKSAYTNVVKVIIGSIKHDITINPNPVTDGIIHLQFLNQPEGKYGVRLLNKIGQVIMSKQISHAEGSSTELIKWNYNLAHGIYQLEVTNPGGGIKNISVLY